VISPRRQAIMKGLCGFAKLTKNVDLQDSTLETALQNPGYLIQGVILQEPSSDHPWGLRDKKKWLVLQAPATEDVVETAGELAVAGKAMAEVPMLLFQGRHQRLGLARS
jgi:hypothetical protein